MTLDIDRYYRWSLLPASLVVSPLLLLTGRPLSSLLLSTEYRALQEVQPVMSDSEATELITEAILERRPFLAGRFGSTELRALVRFQEHKSRDWLEKIWASLSRLEPVFFNPSNFKRLRSHSGVFPIKRETLLHFFGEHEEAAALIDLFSSWVPGENKIFDGTNMSVARPSAVKPFFQPNPWTSALANRRVLVVHPFSKTIEVQWEKRNQLFDNPLVLPDFDLQIIEAPQTLGGFSERFRSWSDALEDTGRRIARTNFDVALVGCGSYSLPLARRIKEMGRPVVVMGGQLQLLFGIKGRRWDGSRLYNPSWIRPLQTDMPPGFRGADGGAYW